MFCRKSLKVRETFVKKVLFLRKASVSQRDQSVKDDLPCLIGKRQTHVLPGVVLLCNPATLETGFWDGVRSIPAGGNTPSLGGCIV